MTPTSGCQWKQHDLRKQLPRCESKRGDHRRDSSSCGRRCLTRANAGGLGSGGGWSGGYSWRRDGSVQPDDGQLWMSSNNSVSGNLLFLTFSGIISFPINTQSFQLLVPQRPDRRNPGRIVCCSLIGRGGRVRCPRRC